MDATGRVEGGLPMTNAPRSAEAAADVGVLPARPLWSLAVLTVVAFLSAVDRQAFSVLLVPVQKDLHVGDAAMGLMSGAAFAAYALFTIPLARLSDRTNRRNVLAVALAVWSIATIFTGFAGAFFTLLLARLFVGAAESAQGPTTVSLIADIFKRERHGTVFMIYAVGNALGFAFGSAVAGALNDRYSWHVAMLVVGAPGLLVAACLYLTVPEPTRIGSAALAVGAKAQDTLLQRLKWCLSVRTLVPFIIGTAAVQAAYTGWIVWFPVFLMRVYHLSASAMGAVVGLIIVSGAVSSGWGGPVSDVLARRGPRWRLYFLVMVTAACLPFLVASSLLTSLSAAEACAIIYALFSGCLITVGTAAYASLTPPNMRAFVSALVFLSNAIFGFAAAPAAFGFLNEVLSRTYHDQSLRYTLLAAPLLFCVTIVFCAIASRTADADTAAAYRLT